MHRQPRLFGHPLHPLTTHMPLGLLMSEPLWDGVAFFRPEPAWDHLSFWVLAVGLLSALPTVSTGLMAYLSLDESSAAAADARRHMGLMVSALALDLASLLVRGGPAPLAGGRFAVAGGLALLGVAVLGVGGWYGGQLVYRHKAGMEER